MNLFDLYGYCFILLFFYLFFIDFWSSDKTHTGDNLEWDIDLDDFMRF